MLTRSGWLVAVGAVLGAALARLFGVVELYVLVAVAAAVLVLAVVWVRRPQPPLRIQRRVSPPRVTVGALGRVELAVTNRGTRRLAPITLVDPVEGTVGARLAIGPLDAGARQVVGYRLPSLRRGLLRIGPLRTTCQDPFGLARRLLPGPGELTVTVLPAVDPAPQLPLGGGRHEPLPGMSRRVVATSGVEDLVTLRPYVVGDDLRRVHWPSTAHSDELQVRRDEERWQGHLTVVLDTRPEALRPADFERAVSAVAGIVLAVADSGDRVRMAFTSGPDTGMVDARRATHALLEDLALVTQVATDEPHLPVADPRRPTPLVLLTGGRPRGVVDGLAATGFADVVAVTFCAGDQAEVPVVGGRTVAVGPQEPFAAAWLRCIGPEVRAVGARP